MAMNVATATRSSKDQNDDRFFVGEDLGLYAVFDGMGGQGTGHEASELAAELLPSLIKHSAGDPAVVLRGALIETDRRIKEECQGHAGTSVALALRRDDRWTVAHVGGCRIYAIGDNHLARLTEDHTLEAAYRKMGVLSDAAPPELYSKVITRGVGIGDALEVDVHAVEPSVAGLLLISSGPANTLSDTEIAEILEGERSPQQIVDALVERAIRRSVIESTAILVRSGSGQTHA